MSKGQVLVVDWKNKKLLTNQHNNSDDSFYQNKQTICDGEVTLFTTKNSGGNWQMRMRVEGHRQYHQKSLRTKNYETAKERAKKEHAIATVKLSEGKSLFSPPLYKAIELYIQHRHKEVLTESLAQGTFERIKGQLKWLTRYPTVNAEHRLDTFGAKTLYDYQMFRMKRNASLQTIRNELSVINAFCKWAYDEGLHNTEKFLHPKIKIKGTQRDDMRRKTFTDKEYDDICRWLRSWCSVKQTKADNLDADKAFERQCFRHFFLITANTMMRSSELFGLQWKNVRVYEKGGYNWAEILVLAHTSKIKKDRVFVSRGGEYFERLKQLSAHTKGYDFVFTLNNGKRWHGKNRRALTNFWDELCEGVGITDAEERKLALYSTRHYGISKRIHNGAMLTQLAHDCGTSVFHLTQTYYHTDLSLSESNMAVMREGTDS